MTKAQEQMTATIQELERIRACIPRPGLTPLNRKGVKDPLTVGQSSARRAARAAVSRLLIDLRGEFGESLGAMSDAG